MADNFRGLTTGATLGRELPFSQEAEEAVLGGVLRDPSVLPKVIEILKPESFYRPQHQQLFSIIMRMFTTGSKEDLITVINEAVTMGVFETSAMAKNYLLGIMEMVPSTDNIESYCKIIEEKARVRSLINAANQILEKAYDGGEDSQTQLDAAEQSIFEIRQGRDVQGLTRIRRYQVLTQANILAQRQALASLTQSQQVLTELTLSLSLHVLQWENLHLHLILR